MCVEERATAHAQACEAQEDGLEALTAIQHGVDGSGHDAVVNPSFAAK